jgi:hypothetical protein
MPCGAESRAQRKERGFLTSSGRAEFGLAPLPDDAEPGQGRLMLATVRSHDQFNTTIYSNNDRYRGLKGLRTVGRLRRCQRMGIRQRRRPGELNAPR